MTRARARSRFASAMVQVAVASSVAAALVAATASPARAQIGYSGTVSDLSQPNVRATDLTLEQDALGNVFAVWLTSTDVWASRRAPGTRVWGEPAALRHPSGPTGRPHDPDLFVDDRGNAVVVWWREQAGSIGGVVEIACFYGGSTNLWTWSATVPGAVDALYPEVVMDEFGRVTVVWHQSMPGL